MTSTLYEQSDETGWSLDTSKGTQANFATYRSNYFYIAKTKWCGAVYATMGPLYPKRRFLFAKYMTPTEYVGRAMLNVAKRGAFKSVLENQDSNRICRDGS